MTTEEKAQRYDEISKEVKDFFDGKLMMYSDVEQTLNYLFPELGESENEKIRKAIIESLPKYGYLPQTSIKVEEAIAWLEKQGEKEEPQVYDTGDGDIITYSETDGYKVEPKLKIESGKWYVCIKNLLDDYGNIAFCKGDVYLSEKDEYLIPSNSNVPWMIAYCVDTYFKEWTIKDAKDGDVLAFKNNIGGIIICKSPANYNTRSYCRLVNEHLIKREESGWDSTLLVPTTKEQRDLLFAKMKEDGYEWDAEKKELKKISNILEECEIAHIEHGKYYYCIKDYYAGGNKRASKGDVVQALNGMNMMALGVKANEYFIPVNNIKQKSSWSVEDSSKVQRICKYLDEAKKYYADITEVRECMDWLKSLEDRVQPKPTDWSDEDEEMLDEVINNLHNYIFKSDNTYSYIDCDKHITWLKSLEERVQPKPTDWSDGDEENLQNCCGAIDAADYYTYDDKQDMEKWLLQLKERLS